MNVAKYSSFAKMWINIVRVNNCSSCDGNLTYLLLGTR